MESQSNNEEVLNLSSGTNKEVVPKSEINKASKKNMKLSKQTGKSSTKPVMEKKEKDLSTPKNKKLPLILGAVGAVVILLVVVLMIKGKSNKQEQLVAQVIDYEKSGRYAYDKLFNALATFDATLIDSLVGAEDGDSYVAQEWAYVNGVGLREEFITKVCSSVKFEYPKVQQMSTTGVPMVDANNLPIMIDSYMNTGEDLTITVPDFSKLSATMDEDVEYIKKLYKASGYSASDYSFSDELTNLMLQYICDKPALPTKTVIFSLPLGLTVDGVPYIKNDIELDKLLFCSKDLRDLCTKFSQICLDYTGYKSEPYEDVEEQENPEYDEWFKLFTQYYNDDNGVFSRKNSKWEPWYLRDENNNYVLDENGEKVVNYYSIKDKNGNDWIQPAETIFVPVTKYRLVESSWEEETGIMFNWIGQWFLQNEYDGKGSTIVRVGDGSKDRPAGIGTSIITKVLCSDGKYRDVRISLEGYWTGQDAIDYAERFSHKNRGFTTTSVIQLITFELQIENLESKPIEFSSELCLTDGNSNVSARTGTMYGFSELVTLNPGETIVINDWATSTELAHKYVCWGKSFGREFPMVYFDCLAGTGEVPTYSAYEQFTGSSNME